MDISRDAKRAFQLQAYGPAPAIDGVALVPLARHADDGGSLTELVRLTDGCAEGLPGFTVRQVNFSTLDGWWVPESDDVFLTPQPTPTPSPSASPSPSPTTTPAPTP